MKSYKKEFLSIEKSLTDLNISPEKIQSIAHYVDHLFAANLELNLFSRKMEAQDLIENHIYDCIMAYPHFLSLKPKCIADFGSGGGMPGVILAILFPETELRLFEKSPKKCDFLNKMAKIWPNIKVLGAIENEHLLGVDLVTARAFKPISEILNFGKQHSKHSGKYLLYKARKATIEEELNEAKKFLKSAKLSLIELSNPFQEVERHLVSIEF